MRPPIKALVSQGSGPSRQEENQSPTPGGCGRQAPIPLANSPGCQLGQRGLGLGWALLLDVGRPHEALPALWASPHWGRRGTAPVSQLAHTLDVLRTYRMLSGYRPPSPSLSVTGIHYQAWRSVLPMQLLSTKRASRNLTAPTPALTVSAFCLHTPSDRELIPY